MMQMTKEQFDRTVSMNERLHEKNPETYEMMVKLSMIQALAHRLGRTDIQENAGWLYDRLEEKIREE